MAEGPAELKRKKIIDILKWAWIAVVVLAAGWYFYHRYQEISSYLNTLSIARLSLSLLVLLIGKFLVAEITRFSLQRVGVQVGFFEALTITFVTQLGKYLPGGIWHFAGKFGVYKLKGISTKDSTKALVLENLWLFSSSGVLGIVLLLISSRQVICDLSGVLCRDGFLNLISVILPLFWIIGLIFFEWIFLEKKKVQAKEFVQQVLVMISIWIAFGLSYWLVFPPRGGFFLQITGAFSLSWLAGYAAIFAPGGIGIRELMLTAILGAFFSSSEVAIYATVHRLLWVLAEILLGGGSALIFGLPGEKTT